MSRICKERFGVAGGERFAKEGVDGLGPVWQARCDIARHAFASIGNARLYWAGEAVWVSLC